MKSGQTLMDVRHTWDAGGNLSEHFDVDTSDNETFGYDFLDRLKTVSGGYSRWYTYNTIGNITLDWGDSYNAYFYQSSKPHAVTQVGSTHYTYDANGNMLTRGSDNLTWDVENRPVAIVTSNGTSTFVYDGDGKRVKKVEGGQTTIYINKFFEKSGSDNIAYYYLGGKMVAMRNNSGLTYIYQDHLTGTSVTDSGTVETIKYYPYGSTRSDRKEIYRTEIRFDWSVLLRGEVLRAGDREVYQPGYDSAESWLIHRRGTTILEPNR